ncbi:MAG: AraC family transcriptional regulator [Clostridia bacterium]|nr:AraC family transcriptional regulator [Clostridia bacterium]
MTNEREYYIESPNNNLAKSGVEYLTSRASTRGACTASAHIHESIEFLYITEGSFDIFVDDEEFIASAGDLVMFRSNSIHRIYSASDGKSSYLVFKIKPSVLLELADPDRGATYVMRFVLTGVKAKTLWKKEELDDSPILDCVNALVREISTSEPVHDVAVKTAMVSLLVSILRDDAKNGSTALLSAVNFSSAHQIYKAMNYINKNYAKSITVADCAAAVSMSYSYFSRTFKEITGKSFKNYLTEIRINHAEREILLTDKSITEISFECGFNDVSYFISQYKAARGKTPHRFRREL